MDQEKEALIKKLTLEGKNKADVRRELISLGFSTEGFDVVYDALITQLPKPTSAPVKTIQEAAKGAIIGDYKSFEEDANRKKAILKKRGPSLFSVLALVVCCVVVFVVWAQYLHTPSGTNLSGDADTTSEMNTTFDPVDTLMKTKVDATVSSAEYFETRIGGFSDVCKEIVVIAPVTCLETDSEYVIYAPLSGGDYYCADSSKFKGILSVEPSSGERCI